jgi:hypothetical protein
MGSCRAVLAGGPQGHRLGREQRAHQRPQVIGHERLADDWHVTWEFGSMAGVERSMLAM